MSFYKHEEAKKLSVNVNTGIFIPETDSMETKSRKALFGFSGRLAGFAFSGRLSEFGFSGRLLEFGFWVNFRGLVFG